MIKYLLSIDIKIDNFLCKNLERTNNYSELDEQNNDFQKR